MEVALDGCDAEHVRQVTEAHGVTPELFRAALTARDAFGKLSDLIHASAIALVLPRVLEPGEILLRPSLAAGNTPDRLFDVETDRRVAKFKLSRWDGGDGGRQQPTVKDLVRLAADGSGRRAELFVRGTRPITWLKTTRSSVRQQLRRYAAELAAFETAFGSPDVPVSEFIAKGACHVRLLDVEQVAPELFRGGLMTSDSPRPAAWALDLLRVGRLAQTALGGVTAARARSRAGCLGRSKLASAASA